MNRSAVREGILTAGLDAGAGSVKIAILSHQEARPAVLAQVLVRTHGHPESGIERASLREGWSRALADAGVSAGDIDCVVWTGTPDRKAIDAGSGHRRSSLALGARLLFPDAIAALDVGISQIRCVVFNEGSSGRGTTFARVAGGRDSQTSDEIARGSAASATIEQSAQRAVALVRTLAVEGKVALTGGMVLDPDFVRSVWRGLLETESQVSLLISPDAIFAGAYGAAILAARRFLRVAQVSPADPLARVSVRVDPRTLN